MSESPTAVAASPRTRLFVATPAYGCTTHVCNTTGMLAAQGTALARFRDPDTGADTVQSVVGNAEYFGNESHIDRARNRLVDAFLKSDFDSMLFIDADIDFTARDLLRIWHQSLKNPSAIICGAYALKTIVPQFVLATLPGETPDPETGLVKVRHAGTGFMLIPRSLFETLDQAQNTRDENGKDPLTGPAPVYYTGENDPNPNAAMRAYFGSGVRANPTNPDRPGWLSEDYDLCAVARAHGYDILVDRGIELGHWGQVKFPLDPAQIFEAARRYRAAGHPEFPENLV
jgi:hypothetical protein